MSPENDEKLCEKYPKIFVDRNESVRVSPMAWGFTCGDGWFDILDQLCSKIQEHCDQEHSSHACHQVVAIQVKEKFGGLRFYIHGGCADIDQMIMEAEGQAEKTCEVCGKEGKIKSQKGWMSCRCPEHEVKI